MMEVFGRPDDIPVWHRAVAGELPDWDALFAEYVAGVDWPVASFWRELSEHYPDALVLLSVRDDAAKWWKSAHDTIFADHRPPRPRRPGLRPQMAMARDMLTNTFTPELAGRGRPRRRRTRRTTTTVHRDGARRPAARVATGRRVGADLPGARPSGAGRAVPACEQHRRLPRDGRPRRTPHLMDASLTVKERVERRICEHARSDGDEGARHENATV